MVTGYKRARARQKQQIESERGARALMRQMNVAHKYVKPEFKELSADSVILHPTRIVHLPGDNWIREKPSLGLGCSPMPETACAELDDDYVAREKAAQKIAEERKQMIAPMYSKGPYQYLGDAPKEIVRNLGKKI